MRFNALHCSSTIFSQFLHILSPPLASFFLFSVVFVTWLISFFLYACMHFNNMFGKLFMNSSIEFGRLIRDQVVDVLSYCHLHRTKINDLVHRLGFVSHPGQCAWRSCSLHARQGTYTMTYGPIDPIPITVKSHIYQKNETDMRCPLISKCPNETYPNITISRTSNKMLFVWING